MQREQIILMDPHPRTINLILSEEDKRRLEALGKVIVYEGARAPDMHIDQHLPQAVALIGQMSMLRERLDCAPHLRMIANVEGNFLPNVDYEECHRRNIHVLNCSPAFAPAVAEMALGLALACSRGIVDCDAAFREGRESYSGPSNTQAFLLRGQTFGLIGCGNVGRCLLGLLRAFDGKILAYDPWIHEHVAVGLGVQPVGLKDLFRKSRIVFVISAATTENQHSIGKQHFEMLQPGSVVILVGRSEVVDFDALLDAAASGQIRAAIDVFPKEPLPKDHRARKTPNTVLSGHRAGGLPETYREIGRMVVDDLELILRGQEPQRMQRANLSTVERLRGKPINADKRHRKRPNVTTPPPSGSR